MTIGKQILRAALLASAAHSHAALTNISATVLQSQTEQATSCTIVSPVGTTWRGMKALMVFSEAAQSGSNPTLRATLLNNNDLMSNDNWTLGYTINGTAKDALPATVFHSLLRAPMGAQDAALLVSVPVGWALCVSSNEVSSGSTLMRASMSITDVTSQVVNLIGNSTAEPTMLTESPQHGVPKIDAAWQALLHH